MTEDTGFIEPDEAAQLIDKAPCGFLIVDAATADIAYINSTLCSFTGADPAAVVGLPLTTLFTDSSYSTLRALVDAAGSETPVSVTVDLVVDAKTRDSVSVSVMANSLPDADGTVNLTLHSDTAHRLRERTLSTARDQAEAAQESAEAAQETAEAAQVSAEAALGRSQNALEASEEARKLAEAERTQVQILASTLQRTLLPPILSAPNGMDVAAHYHPASLDEVGGDFYDVFPLDKDTWAFFLGDVSGKGAGAAAVTSLTRYTLRAAAVFDRDPISVLHNLNTVLHHEFRGEDPRFCTVAYGIIETHEGGAVIQIASGGHPPALHLRRDGSAQYVHTTGGQLVGALPEPRFTAASVTLERGDVIVLYSDGLTEAITGPGRKRFDDDGSLHTFALEAAPTSAPQIIEDLTDLLTGFGSGVQDDVALLALGVPVPE